jgi:integrase
MLVAVRQRRVRAPSQMTLAQAASEWVDAARAGVVLTRSGERYKPSAVRSYERSLAQLLPVLGHLRLSAVTRAVLQDYVDSRVRQGRAPSTVRNSILPLRAIFRRALQREVVMSNPTLKLALPANRSRRDRVARPAEAAALIAAVPVEDRALWSTAFYAGLRRGELLALQWADVDLQARLLNVTRSWDPVEGFVEPKSRAGARRVPLIDALRTCLLEHRLRQGRAGEGFVFGDAEQPFNPAAVSWRAQQAWKRAGLAAVTLHECRHTYASFMIAAGVNLKALSTYMGHTSITTTLDRYGHLLPGNESEAADLLTSWLEAASAT